jgi:hypothetical protein
MRPSIRELGRNYFASERSWEFIVEVLLFAVIVALAAWPILAAVDALHKFVERAAT